MESRYRTFWRRLGALAIDGCILWPIGKSLAFFFDSTSFSLLTAVGMVLEPVCYFGYTVYMHGRFGQTIGKWITKVQVISIDERRLSMRQALLRDSVMIVFTSLYLLLAVGPLLAGVSPDDPLFERGIFYVLANAIVLWLILETVTVLTHAKSRAIHDFIAGSVVITRSNSSSSGRESA